MRLFKRVDMYLLRAYLQLFAGTFFICLFILLMQFMWRYVNDLVGKGLTIDVLAQFFWYAALTLVPMSLPLAVLLAALISFGNLGERLELLSMKAASISLLRILRPIFVVALCIGVGSFYFQNKVTPEATKQLAALVNSMKQKSPELEIPEGTFYQIQGTGYNFFVERKDLKTGMLYGIMIYNTTSGYQDMQIVLADSGRLQTTADHMHLKLTLYGGERFQNLQNQNGNMMKAAIPYMRESFIKEVDLIKFDSNFEILDGSYFAHDARTKDIVSIQLGIDSLTHRIDSIGRDIYSGLTYGYSRLGRSLAAGRKDSAKVVAQVEKQEPLDSVLARLNENQRQELWRSVTQKSQTIRSDCEFRAVGTDNDDEVLRRHRIEWHKKFTLSLACLIFFFIGAPLGAIIRKGGLGLPVVTSVLIFIFYYIIDSAGEKLAREGSWDVIFGVWLSSLILAPIGAFLTYKANQDSAVFNIDGYRIFFQRLFGLRQKRAINLKEVIIHDPDYPVVKQRLTDLSGQCQAYTERHKLWLFPSYLRLFFRYREDTVIQQLSDELESIVEELHNSKNFTIVNSLNLLPILVPNAHTRPFHKKWMNVATGIFLPLGIFFYLRVWRYRIRLKRDLSTIQQISAMLCERIELQVLAREIFEMNQNNSQ